MGMRPLDHLQGAEPRRGLQVINWQASPQAQAIRGEGGYVVTNPKAIPKVPPADRATADPAVVEHAIPETEPPHYDEWNHALQEFQAG